MPAKIRLKFVPPYEEDLVSLLVYEGVASDGPWTLIDTVTEIGTYPTYINDYTTVNAQSSTDWFAIDWEDSKGARLGLSQAIQGGTENLVGEIVERIQLRDPNVDERVAQQEAEAAIQQYYGVDPYTVDASEANYVIKRGLTMLSLARILLVNVSSTVGVTSGYVAGLVSQTANNASIQNVTANAKDLLDQAMKDLGLSYSTILLFAQTEIAGDTATTTLPDESRLLVEVL